MKNLKNFAIVAIVALATVLVSSCAKNLNGDAEVVVKSGETIYTINIAADGVMDKTYFNTNTKAFVSEVVSKAKVTVEKNAVAFKSDTVSINLKNSYSLEVPNGLIFADTSKIKFAVTAGAPTTTVSNPVDEYYVDNTQRVLTATTETVYGTTQFEGAVSYQGAEYFVEKTKAWGKKVPMPRVDVVSFVVSQVKVQNLSSNIVTVNGFKVHPCEILVTDMIKRQARKFSSLNINIAIPTRATSELLTLVNNTDVQTAEYTRTYTAYVLAQEVPVPECGIKNFIQDESKTQILSIVNGLATYKVSGVLKDDCSTVPVEGVVSKNISTYASPLARYEQTSNKFAKVSYSNPAASVVASHQMADNNIDNADFSVSSESSAMVSFGTNGNYIVVLPTFKVEVIGLDSKNVGEVLVDGTKFTRTEYTVEAKVVNGSFISDFTLASVRQIDVLKSAVIIGEKWADNQNLSKVDDSKYKSSKDLLNLFDNNTTSLKQSLFVLANVSMSLSSDATVYTVSDVAKFKSLTAGSLVNSASSNRTDGQFTLKSAPKTQEFANSVYKVVLSTNEEKAFYGASQHEFLTSSWVSRTYVGQTIDNGVEYVHNGVEGKLYIVTEKFSAKYYNEVRTLSTTRKVFVKNPIEWTNPLGSIEKFQVTKSLILDGKNQNFNISVLFTFTNGFKYTLGNQVVKEKSKSVVSAANLSKVESVLLIDGQENLVDIVYDRYNWVYLNQERSGVNTSFSTVTQPEKSKEGAWIIDASYTFNQETGKVEVTYVYNGTTFTQILDLGFVAK